MDGRRVQALVLIFVRGNLLVAQAEVPRGVKKRAQAHGLQVLAKALGLRLVCREDERPALQPRTERGHDIRFVHAGKARRLGWAARAHGGLERPVFRQAGDGVE